MKKTIFALTLLAGLTSFAGSSKAQIFNDSVYHLPNFFGNSIAGITGNTIVGGYFNAGSGLNLGYTYNGGIFTTISDPYGVFGTAIGGISGNTIFGAYYDNNGIDNGFTYNGGIFTTLNNPNGVGGTTIAGISGNTLVGTYRNVEGINYGFTYSGSTFTTLNNPNGVGGTIITGVSGSTIVGYYYDNNGIDNGFTYNGGIFTTLNNPNGVGGTTIAGISGSTIIGEYYDNNNKVNGFTYNGSSFTKLNPHPDAVGNTFFSGISGSTIFGSYYDKYGQPVPFTASIVFTATPPATPVTPLVVSNSVSSGAHFSNSITPVTATGGFGSTASIVAGTASGNKTVTISTTTAGSGFTTLASDVVDISGNDGDVFTAQLTFDATAAAQLGGATNLSLLYLPPGATSFENATFGDHGVNTTNSIYLNYLGSFATFAATYGVTDSNLGNFLGAYGVDANTYTAWAVIDHNSTFAVGAVPEPSTYALFGLGALALVIAASRKKKA